MGWTSRLAWGALVACGIGAARPAHAWKIPTHVHVAQEAIREALATGKVTVCPVPADAWPAPAASTPPFPCAQYAVDPDLLRAIRQHPDLFHAGAMGPDAYPDVVTGQMRIHPPGHPDPAVPGAQPDVNAGGPNSDEWLQQLWASAWAPERWCAAGPAGAICRDRLLAFTAGFLVHAAGDLYGHTFINRWAGGIFDLTSVSNVSKHVTLEGYVAERTPRLSTLDPPPCQTRSDPYYLSCDGFELPDDVAAFVAQNTADLASGVHPDEANRRVSVPWLLARYQLRMNGALAKIHALEGSLQARYDEAAATLAADVAARQWACGVCPVPPTGGTCPAEHCPAGEGGTCDVPFDSSGTCLAYDLYYVPKQTGVAAALRRELELFEWAKRPAIDYLEAWAANVDEGQKEWVRTSHRVAIDLSLNTDGRMRLSEARDDLQRYTPWVAEMATGSHEVFEIVKAIDDAFLEVEGLLGDLGEAVTNAELRLALAILRPDLPRDYTTDQLVAHYVPHRLLPPAYEDVPEMTFARANAEMGLTSVSGVEDLEDLGDPTLEHARRFDDARFPAVYDSIAAAKLLLLGESEARRLLADLVARTGGPDLAAQLGPANGTPATTILGFVQTLDGSNQWCAAPGYLLARSVPVYRQLFYPLDNAGGRFEEPAPECGVAAPAPPAVALSTSRSAVARGQRVTVSSTVPAAFSTSGPGAIAAASPRVATYTAPAEVPGPARVVLRAEGAAPGAGVAETTVTLLPDLRLVPDLGDAIARAALRDARSAEARAFRERLTLAPGAQVARRAVAGEPPTGLEPAGTLLPGQSLRLRVEPEGLPVEWSVRGPGTMGDRALEGRARTAAAEGRVALREAVRAEPMRALLRGAPPGQGVVRFRAESGAAHVEAVRVALARTLDQAFLVRTSRATYHAPAALRAADQAIVEARALDGSGRTATFTITLLPRRAPLSFARRVASVRPGGTVALAVSPRVPVRYEVVSGPGRIGAAPEDRAVVTERLRTASAPEVPAVPRRLAAVAPSTRARARSLELASAPLAERLQAVARAESTYEAPRAASGTVTVKAIALDGTGRTATMRFVIRR